VNRHEISAWRWIAPETLTQELAATPERYTPWLALEWATLQEEHRRALPKALGPA
jgi:isopentenyl-diphosphate delta-isomerase